MKERIIKNCDGSIDVYSGFIDKFGVPLYIHYEWGKTKMSKLLKVNYVKAEDLSDEEQKKLGVTTGLVAIETIKKEVEQK